MAAGHGHGHATSKYTVPPPHVKFDTETETETDHDHDHEHKQKAAASAPGKRKLILINNKPIAEAFESDVTELDEEEERERKLVAQMKARELRKTIGHSPEELGRSYRFWHPNDRRKSITLKKGSFHAHRYNMRIFDTGHIQKRTYAGWKKEAMATLPSVTGGSEVGNVDDALTVAGAAQMHSDGRTLEKAVRRLSDEISGQGDDAKKSKASQRSGGMVRFSKVDDVEGVYEPDLEDSEEYEDMLTEAQRAALMTGVDLKTKLYNLKELADHLTDKKAIRTRLILQEKGDTTYQRYSDIREQVVNSAERIYSSIRDAIQWFTIWEKEINEINGRFGIVVSAYFVWLRRIFGLSVFTFLATFFFVMIPEFVDYKQYPSIAAPKVPKPFTIVDLIDGGGSLEDSLLYYSGYQNYARVSGSDSIFTNSAARFALALIVIFSVNTKFVVSKVSKFYHTVRLESRVVGVTQTTHFKMIMSAWEFSCDNEEASYYLHKTIARDLAFLSKNFSEKDYELMEIEADKKKRLLAFLVRKFGFKWGNRISHCVGYVFVAFCCYIQGHVLYALCHLKKDYHIRCIAERDDGSVRTLTYSPFCLGGDTSSRFWILSSPSVFGSITTLVTTRIIVKLNEMEHYSTAEWKLLTAMIRAGLLNFTSFAVFYGFWFVSKERLSQEGYVTETLFGEELYRLVVVQGILELIFDCGCKYLYFYIRQKYDKNFTRSAFQPEYRAQAMFFLYPIQLVGTLFCPPISLLVSLRLVIDFYWHRYELLKMSSQDAYSAHASIVYAPYLMTFVLYFLFSGFLEGIYLTESVPSQINGPFILYPHSYDQVILEFLNAHSSISWLHAFGGRGALISVIAMLIASAYFCRQWAKAYVPIQQQLNELILLERGDRDLLLKAIFEIASVSLSDEETDASSTLLFDAVEHPSNPEHAEAQVKELEQKVDSQIDHLIHQVQRQVRAPTVLRRPGERHDEKEEGGRGNFAQISQEQRKHREDLHNIIGRIVDARRKLEVQKAKIQKQANRPRPPTQTQPASGVSSLFSLKK